MSALIHKRLTPDKNKKYTIIAVFTALLFGMSIVCEKTCADTDEQITTPESSKASEADTLSEKIQHLVMDLEYSETVAQDFTNMVMGWKNKQSEPHLAVWKRHLSEARNEYEQKKFDVDILARNEIIKAQELSQKILYTIEYEKSISDLDEVILNEKANCLGFTQTFYILANSIGLKTKAIDVLETAAHRLKSDEEKNKRHIACLVYLADDRNIMVDLAQNPVPMVSKPFELQNEFRKNGLYWERKNNNYYYLYTHKKIRITDKDGIVSIVYFNRSAKNFESNRIDKALSNLSRAIELNSKFDLAYNNRANAYTHLEQYDQAISDYNEAIELNPDYALSYSNRGDSFRLSKQYSKAISDCNKAIELDPNLPDAYYNRGNIYYELGQHDKTIIDFNEAIKKDPNFAVAYAHRGRAYAVLGKNEEAKKDLMKAVELEPELKEKVKKLSDYLELNLKFD